MSERTTLQEAIDAERAAALARDRISRELDRATMERGKIASELRALELDLPRLRVAALESDATDDREAVERAKRLHKELYEKATEASAAAAAAEQALKSANARCAAAKSALLSTENQAVFDALKATAEDDDAEAVRRITRITARSNLEGRIVNLDWTRALGECIGRRIYIDQMTHRVGELRAQILAQTSETATGGQHVA